MKKNLAQKLFLAWLVTKMAVLVGCKKEPMPTPQPTPDPTEIQNDSSSNDTSHVHGDTTIPYSGDTVEFYYGGGVNFTPIDTIQEYLRQGYNVRIYWGACSEGWTTRGLHNARDSLRPRIALSPNVFGKGTVLVHQLVPEADSMNPYMLGAPRSVVDDFIRMGYDVVFVIPPDTCKKVNNDFGGGSAVIEDKRMRAMNDQRRYWSNNLGRKMTSNQY